MYEYFSGRLVSKSPTEAVLDVGGVGYQLRIPLSTYEALPRDGEVRLLCHHHVREDIAQLYGFATNFERIMFRLLLSVSRIGPGVAIGILSAATVGNLVAAIAEGDARMLESIKGVGGKMAQRLIMELADPIQDLAARLAPTTVSAGERVERDAVLALTALGYTRSSAQKAVESARKSKGADTVEGLIKEALRVGR